MIKLKGRVIAALVALLCSVSCAWAQAQPYKFISAATTNSTLVKAADTLVYTIVVVNTTTTIYYLKLYNKAVAPTCNSDAVQFLVPIPYGASNAGGGAVISIPGGMTFQQGLGFCITAGSADNDNAAAATGVIVSFAVK